MRIVFLAAIAAAGLAASAQAAPNLVVNGGFEATSNGPGQFDNNTTASGWTSNGYNFIFGSDPGATVTGQYGGLSLYAPSNGYNNGFTASPDGGNFVGADGAYLVAPVQQTITGLTAGKSYDVSFYWGGAQQSGYTGTNTEQWEVRLGNGPSQLTDVYVNPTAGFSGWFSEKFTFTADGATQVLSFLAHGTPEGVPPFSLLDGVTMTASVPEPASWAMMLIGFGAIGFASRRRGASTAIVAA